MITGAATGRRDRPQGGPPSTAWPERARRLRIAASMASVSWEPPPDPDALPRVLSRADALGRGLSRHAVDRNLATRRWRRVLPHTYFTADSFGFLDRCRAALAFCGAGSLITGAAALRLAGVRTAPQPDTVHVLVAPTNRARSIDWVRVQRTQRPADRYPANGPRCADVARASADFALSARHIDDVRAVVSEIVRRGMCTIAELNAELRGGPTRGSAALRQVIGEVGDGAWSAPEARAAKELRCAGVSGFVQNARIELPGERYCFADFLWPQLWAVLEIDSVEYHIDPKRWRATMDKHLALETLGYSVVHRPPSLVFREPFRFRTEMLAWLATVQRQRAAERATTRTG